MLRRYPIIAVLLVIAAALGARAPHADGRSALSGLAEGSVRTLAAGEPVPLQLGGQRFTLTAEADPIIAGTKATTTYSGRLHPDTGLVVRLVLDGRVWGLIIDPSTGSGWALQARPDGGADAIALPHLHRHPIGGEDGKPAPADTEGPRALDEPTEGTLKLRLAVELDHALYNTRPEDWQEMASQLFHLTEAVFGQIDVAFSIERLDAWETPDPYGAGHACQGAPNTSGPGKLEQLREHWNADPDRRSVPRDTVHLLTRNLSGGFIGCAYIGQLNTTSAYGVSRINTANPATDAATLLDHVNLLAHEIGHNFGGLHERSVGAYGLTGAGPASMVAPYTIMNPVAVKGVLRFSDLSSVHSPTGHELNNAGHMRGYAQTRLGPG